MAGGANATQSSPTPTRPIRTVGSSPQLLPLKQIHEEQEITSDEDALSVHSQTSVVRHRHSSLSMASPELARRLLVSRLHHNSILSELSKRFLFPYSVSFAGIGPTNLCCLTNIGSSFVI